MVEAHFSPYGYLIVQAPFVEKTLPTALPWHLLKVSWPAICMGLFLPLRFYPHLIATLSGSCSFIQGRGRSASLLSHVPCQSGPDAGPLRKYLPGTESWPSPDIPGHLNLHYLIQNCVFFPSEVCVCYILHSPHSRALRLSSSPFSSTSLRWPQKSFEVENKNTKCLPF